MRQAFILILLLALSAVGGFVVYQYVLKKPPEQALHGMRPEFVLQDVDGQPRSITEWDGQALIVNFWATWCRPCLREIPLLNSLQSRLGGQSVQVIGIAVDEIDEVRRFMSGELEITYPVLVGGSDAVAAAEAFGIEFIGLPYTAFTDRQGRILGVHLGELTAEDAAGYLSRLD